MNLLETYLRELHETRSTGMGVKETSYYGALANLLNGVGATLKPRVRCLVHVQNQGAGIPDSGLFTSDQKVDDAGQMTRRLATLLLLAPALDANYDAIKAAALPL